MKSVLITGVNGGMGASTAEKFLNNGYQVFGLDIQNESVVSGVNYFKCDITDDNRINEIAKEISNKIECLSAIISLAGIYAMDSLLEIENERMKKIIHINSLGR